MTIRFATPADAPALLAIYAPYVAESVISFEYDVPTVAEFAERIRTIQAQYPYLVAEADGQLLGYAYAARHRDRTAYQWSVDTTVYLHPDKLGRGLGRQLYTTLFDLLRRQGYCNAYAGITLPNPRSEALHRALGFEPVGIYTRVGYKFSTWHDVIWLQLSLQPHPPNPSLPIPITASPDIHQNPE